MDDSSKKEILSKILMDRMELKSRLMEISYILRVHPNKDLNRELDRILDRLDLLEKLESEIDKLS
ncbi:MAG: hypothetical protein LBE56_14710 [Tannerella sp.]|jgi:hypothetical protein|nr:hypothetical protein [Tannerella sp.]